MIRRVRLPALRRLARDRRGVAAVEFAFMAPLFLLATMGIFDLAWQYYMKATLSGIVEEAGRSATLQAYANNQDALDEAVRAQVGNVYRGINVDIERRAYAGYGDVRTPERFTDADGNGRFDDGECFYDSNGNGRWDADPSVDGNGRANQVVEFTASVDFVRIFPLWRMLGQPQVKRISASTLLRNQPYSDGEGGAESIC